MSRDELASEIISAVGAETPAQIAKVNTALNDVVLAIQLRHHFEILISEMNESDINAIKSEVMRRYRA